MSDIRDLLDREGGADGALLIAEVMSVSPLTVQTARGVEPVAFSWLDLTDITSNLPAGLSRLGTLVSRVFVPAVGDWVLCARTGRLLTLLVKVRPL